jgi:hypothetical protein
MEFDEELTDEFIEGFTAAVLASRADKHWNLLQERRARQQQSQGPRPARVAFERYDYQRYEFDGRNYTPVND